MRKNLSRKEAQEKIDEFFRQTEKLDPKYVKKIKRLAMAHNIKLGQYRKRFCKKCFADLRKAKTRVKKGFKIVECGECGGKMRWRINS